MRHTTIRQALQNVADNPTMMTDEVLVVPAHELVCRTLFDIANSPMTGKRGAMSKANVARRMIFDRMAGKRRAGSHPATRRSVQVAFADMTGGEIGS